MLYYVTQHKWFDNRKAAKAALGSACFRKLLKTKEILFTNYVANDELYNDSKINLPASDGQRQTDWHLRLSND